MKKLRTNMMKKLFSGAITRQEAEYYLCVIHRGERYKSALTAFLVGGIQEFFVYREYKRLLKGHF